MFIKKITNKKNGVIYLTYRLVKSIRVDGNSMHISILELGSLSGIPFEKHKALADRIEQLILHDSMLFENHDIQVEEWAHYFFKKLVKKQFDKPRKFDPESAVQYHREIINDCVVQSTQRDNMQVVDLDSFDSIDSQEIGAEWLCTQAINELGLDRYLANRLGWSHNETVIGMLALLGRLLYPSSELKTAKWLNENSGAFELFSPESATVDRNRLMQCTKKLYQNKDEIEKYLSEKIASIFNIENKLILYDLTNTHFEGQMKQCQKAKFGRNKQKRNDCRQITLGLLTNQEGFCLQSRYYSGNVSEPKTFAEVLTQLEPLKKGINRPVIVIDAGIATEDNLKMSMGQGIDYICVSRSAHKDLMAKVEKDKLVSFINDSEEEVKTQFFHQTIDYMLGEEKHTAQETLLYIETPTKYAKEKSIFGKKQQGFETGLAKIKESVDKPQKNKKNKSIKNIHERIGRLKEKYSGIAQAYQIEVVQQKDEVSDIQWKYKENNTVEPKLGTYFIRTNLIAEKEELLWKAYRTLGEIESTFRILKSDLHLRPVFHQKEFNIESHLNLAVLAYFIVSFIRFRLKLYNCNHSWEEIVRIMNTQKYTLNSIINEHKQKIVFKSCTRPSLNANEIYKKMNYKPVPFYRKRITLNF